MKKRTKYLSIMAFVGAMSSVALADYSPNRVSRTVANTWTASQRVASVTLSDGATINTNAALGNSFHVTIAGNRTMAAPTNMVSGGTYQWEIIQSGGSNTITWNAVFTWPGGSAPVLQTAAGAKDLISCYYDGTSLLCGSLAGAGSVSSVGMSVPSWLSVSGSPITTSGTLALSTASGQTAARVLATPGGSTGAVDLRALANEHLPDTAVTPGTYTISTITVNQKGVITSASNGSSASDPLCATAAPSFSNGASGLLGTPTSTSVSGDGCKGIISFTTGTVGTASQFNTAALAEAFKVTFAGGYTATNGCVAQFFAAGADNDAARKATADAWSNYNYNNVKSTVCTTTTCSLYWNSGAAAGGWQSSTAYKVGYQIGCY